MLRTAITAMFGSVDRVLVCDDGISVAVIPGELDDGDDEGGYSCVTTGLSARMRDGEVPRVELTMLVIGNFDAAVVDATARDLGRLATLVSQRNSHVGDVFEFDWSEPFAHMQAVAMTEYMSGPDYLFEVDPPVRLIGARPIFEAERAWVSRLGPEEARKQFAAAKTNWFDPGREVVFPAKFVEGILDGRGEMSNLANLDSVWADLENWYSVNKATATTNALRPGATDSEIEALQKTFGHELPDDLIASLRIHNGTPTIDAYDVLPIKSILALIADHPTGQPSAPDSSNKVKAVAWSQGWLPFAQDSNGDLYCIDQDPASDGTAGQMIGWERDGKSAQVTSWGSFSEWLADYRTRLLAGDFEVDEEGFVNRA